MINRAVVILQLKKPFVDWINEADPLDKLGISLASANEDNTIYLVPDEVADDPVNTTHWIKLNWETLFENELNAWIITESLWPKKRNFKMFEKWIRVEVHSMIVDTVDEPIVDDGY